MIRIFSMIFACSILLLASADESSADFVATPMEFSLSLAPGAEITETVVVKNRADDPIAVKIYTGDFHIQPDGKEDFIEAGTLKYSCANWIELSPEEMELEPGESQPLRYKIRVPENAAGTFWAMIFIEQISKPSVKTADVEARQFNIITYQRIGVRVFQQTPESDPGNGSITAMSVEWDKENGGLSVLTTFDNPGTVLLKCKGTIEIKDIKGVTVRSMEMDVFNCYPESQRVINKLVTEPIPAGQYFAVATVDYGGNDLVAGQAVFDITGSEKDWPSGTMRDDLDKKNAESDNLVPDLEVK